MPAIQRGSFSAIREVHNHIHSLPKLGTKTFMRKEKYEQTMYVTQLLLRGFECL